MDQNKQKQQHGDVICFYWLSDPEEEVGDLLQTAGVNLSFTMIIDWEEINTGCVRLTAWKAA